MKKTSKRITGIALSAMMMVSALPVTNSLLGRSGSFISPITASAAAFKTELKDVGSSNKDIRFDKNQITTKISNFKSQNYSLSYYSNKYYDNIEKKNIYEIKGSTKVGVPLLDRQTIYVKAKIPNTDKITLLNNTKIEIINYYNGFRTSETFAASEVQKQNNDYYTIKFKIITKGNTYDYIVSGFSTEPKSISVTSNSNGAENYKKVEVKTPSDYDDLYISIPNKSGLTDDKIKKWAINHTLLANSISELTGSKTKTLFIAFDYPSDYAYAWASDYGWHNLSTNTNDMYNIVCLGSEATRNEIELIKMNKDLFNYSTIHEFGHAYNFMSGNKFQSAYGYYTNIKDLFHGDENYTNVRALTAIQNCRNICSFKIREEQKIGNKCTGVVYERTPYDIYDLSHPYATDYTFYFAKAIVNLGDWNTLETFYRGVENDDSQSKINKDTADALMKYTGFSIDSSVKNKRYSYINNYDQYLKFVNGLRHLYLISECKDNPNRYNKDKFLSFVNQVFTIPNDKQYEINQTVEGKDFIRDMSNSFFIE